MTITHLPIIFPIIGWHTWQPVAAQAQWLENTDLKNIHKINCLSADLHFQQQFSYKSLGEPLNYILTGRIQNNPNIEMCSPFIY